MELFEIGLESPSAIYFPGQSVGGRVYFKNTQPLDAQSINIRIFGETKTNWGKYNETVRRHQNYSSKMVMLDGLAQPWVAEDGVSATIQPGLHIFPFVFPLPKECPPSFDGNHGSIQYLVHVKVQKILGPKMETQRAITVLPILDLNHIPTATYSVEDQKSISRLHKSRKEHVEVKVTIPKRGFIAGESIPISINIKNTSTKPVNALCVKLVQISHFSAQQETSQISDPTAKLHYKNTETVLTEIKHDFGKKNLENGKLKLPIPNTVLCSFKTKFIQVLYKVLVDFAGDKMLECSLSVILGTVPIQANPPSYGEAVGDGFEYRPPEYEDHALTIEAAASPTDFMDERF